MQAYRIAYDGQPFYGFQRQPDVDTVENALLDGLAALGVTDGGVPPGYAAAGRTDRGVSARAQTVAFEAPDWLSPSAFNSELPDPVRAWARASVPETFHATHDAVSREYTYYLHREGLDEELVAETLAGLAGDHDVHNLTPDETGTQRSLSTALDREPPFLVCRFRAGGFPRQFVRRAVSLVATIARGERTLSFLDRVLSTESLSGPAGIGPAPPEPLVMTDVSYRDIEFIADGRAAERTRRQFDGARRRRAAGSRVAGELAGVGETDGRSENT